MHALNIGLNADKFATFWMFSKRIYHSFVLQMPLYTLEAADRKCETKSSTLRFSCIFKQFLGPVQTPNFS